MINIQNIDEFIQKSEQKCQKQFEEIDKIALYNQEKVLKAFQKTPFRHAIFTARPDTVTTTSAATR